jgi:hypothetical protein
LTHEAFSDCSELYGQRCGSQGCFIISKVDDDEDLGVFIEIAAIITTVAVFCLDSAPLAKQPSSLFRIYQADAYLELFGSCCCY